MRIFILVAILAMLLVAGCSKTFSDDTPPSGAAPAQNIIGEGCAVAGIDAENQESTDIPMWIKL